MRYTSFLCILVCATLVCANRDEFWREWKRVHGKTYKDDSEPERRAQWERSVDEIQEHNLRYDLGLETYTMGLNQFSDLSWEEFKQMYLSIIQLPTDSQGKPFVPDKNLTIPDSLDWRQKGIVTPVKNQGSCGSSWAFSTVGAVESQYNKTFNETLLLSEQQLVDCSFGFGNDGCNKGFVEHAYRYLQWHTLETQNDYPYQARKSSCQHNATKGRVMVSDWTKSEWGSENELKAMVATLGPTATYINVDRGFQMYKSGIYTSETCNRHEINHALLTVGYGTEAGSDYWIIKNSWSSTWGEQGYARFRRNLKNMCGIAFSASVPEVVKV